MELREVVKNECDRKHFISIRKTKVLMVAHIKYTQKILMKKEFIDIKIN